MTADWFRFAVFTILIVSVVMNAGTLMLYTRVWMRLPSGMGLTPLHVALVSMGTLLLQGALAWALIEGFGRAIDDWAYLRLGMYGLGSLLIVISLGVVMRLNYQRAKQRRA